MLGSKFIGVDAVKKDMTKMQGKLSDRKTLNAQAVAVLDRWIQKNFQQEGKLAQKGGWKPLSAKTLKMRKRGGSKILQDTGTLRSRWKHLYTAKKASIQSGVDYGEQHEKGLGGLPVRKILPPEEKIMPLLMKIYRKFVQVIIK